MLKTNKGPIWLRRFSLAVVALTMASLGIVLGTGSFGLPAAQAVNPLNLPFLDTGNQTTSAGGSNWRWQNPTPQGNDLYSLTCPVANVCYAVGGYNQNGGGANDFGTILKTTDGGRSWQDLHWTLAGQAEAIGCVSALTCFATLWNFNGGLASYGAIIKTTDGGQSWSQSLVGSAQQPVGFLAALTCIGSDTCYAGGLVAYANSTPAVMWSTTSASSATTNWTNQSGALTGVQPLDRALIDAISCFTPANCVAVSAEDVSLAFTTTDGGAHWTQRPFSGSPAGFTGLSCVVGSSFCLAVGPVNTPYYSQDGGVSWNRPATDYLNKLRQVYCYSTSNCIGVGGDVRLPSAARTTNGGQSWQSVSIGGTGQLNALNCSGATCLAVGNFGTTLKSSDSGQSWATLSGGPSNGGLAALSCPAPGVCYAGGDLQDNALNSILLATSTAGFRWQPQPLPASLDHVTGLVCSGLTTCYYIGVEAGSFSGAIYATRQGATGLISQFQYSNSTSYANSFPTALACPGPTTCYVVGTAGSLVYTTDGRTWHDDRSTGTTEDLASISCPGLTTCFVAGKNSEMRFTTDGGQHWSPTQSIPASSSAVSIQALTCPSVQVCYATILDFNQDGSGVQQAIILKGINNGGSLNWTRQPNRPAYDYADPVFSAAQCLDETHCYLVGSTGTIWTTSDGSNWIAQASGTSANLHSISCLTYTACYIAGDNGTILTNALATDLAVSQASDANNNTPGTLSYALTNATYGQIITFKVDSVQVTSGNLPHPKNGQAIGTLCGPAGPPVTIMGNGSTKAGLILGGNNTLYGLHLANFNSPAVKVLNNATANHVGCVVASHS